VGYSDNTIGSSGVEALYNKELMSPTGIMETAQQQIFGSYVRGQNVRLTLDKDLQVYAAKLLSGKKGAIVAIEPSTGKLLAVVSKPDFNPNEISNTWKSLKKNSNSPLINRAFEGLYPPGSIFKVVTTSAMLERSLSDFSINCIGTTNINGLKINDHNSTSHGKVDLDKGFKLSCNSFFIQAGLELGGQQLKKEAEKWGFNDPILNYYNYKPSVFESKSEKKEVALEAFGHGNTLITPLHASLIAASVANQGIMMKPMLVESYEDEKGKILRTFKEEEYLTATSAENAKILTTLMRHTVVSGTAIRADYGKIKAAGKTGTAETGNAAPHSWFIGFAPYDHPRIAIAVLLENSGSGGENAAPIAGKVMYRYLHE